MDVVGHGEASEGAHAEDHGEGPAVEAQRGPGGQGEGEGDGRDDQGASGVGAPEAGGHQRMLGSHGEQGAPVVEGHHVEAEGHLDLK